MCVKEITRALAGGGSITTSKMMSLGLRCPSRCTSGALDRAYVAVVHAETLASHLRPVAYGCMCCVCVCVCT